MRRKNNQDSIKSSVEQEREDWERNGHMFIVADGMGGHAVGELASKIAVDTLPLTYKKLTSSTNAEALREAMEQTNGTIYERGNLNHDFNRMGTTCSALVLCPEGALIGHVGDSRIYRTRGDRIDQLTFDHSLQWEMLRRGQGTPEDIFMNQPKNVITRSMGPEPAVEVDIEGPYPVQPGDAFILCSDGLTNHVSDEEIGVAAAELSSTAACRFLVNLANLRGGTDNISVSVIKVGAIPEGATPSTVRRGSEENDELGGLWLGMAWIVAAFFCLGTILILTGYYGTGGGIVGGAVLAAGYLLKKWRESLPPAPIEDRSHATVLWRPYRTSPAKLTRRILDEVVRLQQRMEEVAQEEDWKYDRVGFERMSQKAHASLQARTHHIAFRYFAAAVQILMDGLKKQSQQKKLDSRIFRPEELAQQEKNS
ncbi:MAG: serine/threonine-protein phosphatase [Planctomycetaceae bacterium]|nr:serine/threonine-protein phosphatase [Planctomycetaceae bacterium]